MAVLPLIVYTRVDYHIDIDTSESTDILWQQVSSLRRLVAPLITGLSLSPYRDRKPELE